MNYFKYKSWKNAGTSIPKQGWNWWAEINQATETKGKKLTAWILWASTFTCRLIPSVFLSLQMENLCVCFLFCFQQLALSFALDFTSSSSSFYLQRGNPSHVLNGSLTPSSLVLLPSSNIHPLPCLSEIITARFMAGPSTVIDVRRLVLFQRFAFFTNTTDRCLFSSNCTGDWCYWGNFKF